MAESADVLILGGGYAGLAAAHRLTGRNLHVRLLEAGPAVGGHAACCTVAGAVVERFYHHFKPEDVHILELIAELGLGERLVWRRTRMGFYVDGKLYPFSSPADLLRFRPLPIADRLRFAWGVLRTQWTSGRPLESVSAEEWARRDWSPAIYARLMRPLLVNKFEVSPDVVSAAFLHGRIKAVAGTKSKWRGGERLACLRGGLDALTERLAAAVEPHCEVALESPVERIDARDGGFEVTSKGRTFRGLRIVSTLPLDQLERAVVKPFRSEIQYQGVACAVFAIREPLPPMYWVNVLDPGVSFRLLVNHSTLGDCPFSVVYCSSYVGPADRCLDEPAESVLDRYQADVHRIFGRVTVLDRVLSRSRNGTPVFDRDFRAKLDRVHALLPGVSFAGNAMVFPGARTLSSVIGTGYRAADRAAQSLTA